MPLTESKDWALTVSYEVKLDEAILGAFATCEGLGIEVVLETREEGGNNAYPWQFPTRLKYPNVKLTRPLSADAEKTVQWITGFIDSAKRVNGVITAKNSAGKAVLHWELTDVVPVRWTGPSLNTDSSKVAVETLELAHHGFQVKR
ncbi:phage tail protein [Microbacterium sp. BK668]|uniref:phage tail protein n=1 Tax=Microbacterium sp. BK668 TaxID=2512118 RepID=UPI00105C890B|nr:phage tail protein [Microbacterium sp. BK668]TDN93067.1 phage tail-like protein [Microbacterium sp. BK668]